MKIEHIDEGVGRIVKGVNTTPDVGVDQTRIEAAKFGNKVDKDGRPPTLSSAVKGKSTNVLFNLGLAESLGPFTSTKTLQQQHEKDIQGKIQAGKDGVDVYIEDGLEVNPDVLRRWGITNLDVIKILMDYYKKQGGKVSEARYTAMEWACIEGGHDIDDLYKNESQPKQPGRIFTALENFADGKKKVQEAFDNPYPITWEYLKPTGPSSAIGKVEDGSALDIHISEDPAGIYEIEFARGQSNKNMGRSGQGDEFRIFATVQAAMSEWWQQLDKTSARKITFYANKEDGNRARLYKRFLKMWGDKSEWDIEVNGNAKPGLVAYTLTNPDPDEPQNDKKTWLQRFFGEEQTIENFADGKKKGKSRPGRVKKSGASCNGSVTDLRKRAKNASGEKAKMYHWCANMKSGKKKK